MDQSAFQGDQLEVFVHLSSWGGYRAQLVYKGLQVVAQVGENAV